MTDLLIAYLAAALGIYITLKFNPVSQILTHCWGEHYKIIYKDANDSPHTVHIFVKDPREAILIHEVFQEFAKQSKQDPPNA